MFGYKYDGFWKPADTFKERAELDARYNNGDRPWMVWEHAARRRRRRLMISLFTGRHRRNRGSRSTLRRYRDRNGRHAADVLRPRHPGLRVRALVLSGGGTEREAEEREALAAFCPGADVELTVLDLPDGRAPAQLGSHQGPSERFRGSRATHMWYSARSATTLIKITDCWRTAADRVPRPPRARLRDPEMGEPILRARHVLIRWTPRSPRKRRVCCSSTTHRRRP